MALVPGKRVQYGDRTFVVGSHVVLAHPWLLPQHRFELHDGSDTVLWLDIQIHSWGYNGVWVVTPQEYSGLIPADDPSDLEFAGRSFSPGLWGTNYHYTPDNYPERPSGIVKYFKYNPNDRRGEFGFMLPGSDALHFQRFDNGPWIVSLAQEVQATDLVVLYPKVRDVRMGQAIWCY